MFYLMKIFLMLIILKLSKKSKPIMKANQAIKRALMTNRKILLTNDAEQAQN